MRKTLPIWLGAFIFSWVGTFILFWATAENPSLKASFAVATIVAFFGTFFIALPIIIIKDSSQSFKKTPARTILHLITIAAVVGCLKWPALYIPTIILVIVVIIVTLYSEDQHLRSAMEIDIKNIDKWPDNFLLEIFTEPKIRKSDRQIIHTEMQKRGLI